MLSSLVLTNALAVFILGLLIGSFLNVVIFRYNTGKGMGGRSVCLSCGKRLTSNELIPLLSFLLLRGRCAVCKSHISFQYPLVELLTGVLFLTIFLKEEHAVKMIFYGVVFSLLIAIAVYDVRHKIVPNGLVYTFITLAFLQLFISIETLTILLPSYEALLSGIIIAFPLCALWAVSHGRWIGLGDAKLALGMGWLLGLTGGLSGLLLSFWIGAAVSVSIIASIHICSWYVQKYGTTQLNLSKKEITMRSEVPFAPFIILSTYLVYLFDLDIISLFVF